MQTLKTQWPRFFIKFKSTFYIRGSPTNAAGIGPRSFWYPGYFPSKQSAPQNNNDTFWPVLSGHDEIFRKKSGLGFRIEISGSPGLSGGTFL